ncbi:cobalt-precorrin-6A reductase [Ancylobacter amanitiformis]|uniref:Precorrin-6A/cobalt-precorrin-6A reductase n=1 Tax=Ancylobacter amanitiformis TaxID=217069 RepID=A0ABU0LW52_9HYPH|nr:cobalt-precorrin-6A reductase [Ancylobacter amanitiformis]MDQ0512835.1 precorrin-6A/cobalt-precorrin-6A reductase [Ancylobacter amanitiformis]
MNPPSPGREAGAPRLLILGGTLEARELAATIAAQGGYDASLSLAGRTRNPHGQPLPLRSGGFGGVEGLVEHLKAERIDALVDATHPFAAIISRNAAEAARRAGVPLLALVRPAWERRAGDIWTAASDIPEAVGKLGARPRRVLVTLGRNEVHALEAAPQHDYLVRSIDAIEPPLALAFARYIEARGPFEEAGERALLVDNRIDAILSKNSGGAATYGKIAAARALGIEVIMVARPARPDVATVASIAAAMAWLARIARENA